MNAAIYGGGNLQFLVIAIIIEAPHASMPRLRMESTSEEAACVIGAKDGVAMGGWTLPVRLYITCCHQSQRQHDAIVHKTHFQAVISFKFLHVSGRSFSISIMCACIA